MKKTIATIATAVLMTLSFSSFANKTIDPLRAKDAKEILLTYVEASSLGSVTYNNFLFTEDFQYENRSNNNKSNKKEYIKFLQENKGIVFDCQTKYEILDSTNNIAIAKNTWTFDNFTRVDHITMVMSKDGWKVSKVVTSYL